MKMNSIIVFWKALAISY